MDQDTQSLTQGKSFQQIRKDEAEIGGLKTVRAAETNIIKTKIINEIIDFGDQDEDPGL